MKQGTAKTYEVFTRTWWINNPAWPDGLEPHPGPRRRIATRCLEEEAMRIAKEWNRTHKPGRLSRKAEWGEE